MREASKVANQVKMNYLIMESDSQLLIYSVLGKINVLSQISNLDNDILLLVRGTKIIQFNYSNRATTSMTDKRVKKAHCTRNNLYYYSSP